MANQHRDLVIDPTWPKFYVDLDIIDTQHLFKCDEDRMKTIWFKEKTVQNTVVENARRPPQAP